MIGTRNKKRKSDSSDPSNWMNPAITLDPTDDGPGDPKVQNK